MAVQVALRNKAKELASILPANPKYLALSNNFGISKGQLTGSSPKMLVKLVNSGLLPKDARIATREDLEKTIKRKNDFSSEFYIGFGLNLDSRDTDYRFNHVYAKALAEDLKKIGINLRHAKLISYNILTENFRLSRKGKDIAKSYIQNINDFKWCLEPSFSGLYEASLDRGGFWSDGHWNWDDFRPDSRVVVITGEASSQKFLEEYNKFEKDKRDKTIADAKRAITEANNQYKERVKSLRVE